MEVQASENTPNHHSSNKLPRRHMEDCKKIQTVMDLWCGTSEGTCGNLHLWENGSQAVDCGFEDTLDCQSKESGKLAGSRCPQFLCTCLPPHMAAPKPD